MDSQRCSGAMSFSLKQQVLWLQLGIGHLAHRDILNLSGGQRSNGDVCPGFIT